MLMVGLLGPFALGASIWQSTRLPCALRAVRFATPLGDL